MKIVIDTNLLIDFSRQNKLSKKEILWPQLVACAQKKGHQLVLPTAALFELFSGTEMRLKNNRQQMENILKDILILDINKEISLRAAELFRDYQQRIGVIDYLLAATSLVLEGELATLNAKHFQMIKNLKLFDLKKLG